MSPIPALRDADEAASVARIEADLARGRWCAALDRAFRLPGLPVRDAHDPARRLAVVARTLARAGRASAARHFADLARRALPKAGGETATRIALSLDPLPPNAPPRTATPLPADRPRTTRMPPIGTDTAKALGRAEEALTWLDHAATRSAHAADWARLMRWCEARDSARLDGVHAALLELIHHALPRPRNRPVHTDRALVPYLDHDHAPTAATPRPVDLAEIAVRHLSPAATHHAHRMALAGDVSRLLSGPWLPFAGGLVARRHQADASDAEHFVRLVADATTAACHAAVTTLHDLERLHGRLATLLPFGRLSRLALRDLFTRGLITAPDLARRHPMSAKTAVNILGRFLDRGLVVPYNHHGYARCFYNPDLVDLLTRTPKHL
ncbi:hypothetical protein GCM10022243_41470 [Saccharothrix violaceirubra]|uniref:Uncharacterized protein n=1 Tax=Saccharothrix violaceirubra TaxID=413306 RepID=A0A7W7WZ43_9PSEU|nr:hypothetical protein [Saccharothrix violaceirubra]MBB4968403.1 hypothetical protein [Saccharothrix violaceirubra]